MNSVTLQFVGDNRSLGSRLISWFGGTGMPYSHVDVVMPDGMLLGARNDRIDDVPAGVQIRDPSYVRGRPQLQVTLSCTSHQSALFYKFLKEQVGKPYDHLAIFSFIINRKWREEDAWICSELACAALEQAGIVRQLAVKANKITPADLILILSALTNVVLPSH